LRWSGLDNDARNASRPDQSGDQHAHSEVVGGSTGDAIRFGFPPRIARPLLIERNVTK
jgi:hypothetical protein